MRSRIFIGSSSEGLDIAKAIQVNLDRIAEVTVWSDNVFQLSASNYDSLERVLDNSDWGIFILTPDDVVRSRSKQKASPRDNVIFELGLFAGRLGLSKTFIVHSREMDLKIPSDLLGIITATYERHKSENLIASVGAVCTQINMKIEEGLNQGIFASWNDLCDWIKNLASKLRRSPSVTLSRFMV
jgi:predicted nucleotide-binding protein